MPLPVILIDAATEKALATVDSAAFLRKITGGNIGLVTTNVGGVFGTFKAATRTTTGTTTIATPDPLGSIIVTWIAVSGEKQAGSSVEVRFTDGTNDVTLVLISQVDAPPNLAIPLPSRVQGWRDAKIDMITSGAGDATVSIGYIKIPEGIPFAEWDALR